MNQTKLTSFILILATSLLALIIFIFPMPLNKKNISKVNNGNVFKQIQKAVKRETSIMFVGDIMLGRSVMKKTINEGDSYYPFKKTSEFLNNADITFANLENPIVKNCPETIGGFKFCTNYETAKGLNFAGIDIVSLANNHSENYGLEGLAETKKFLGDNDISYVGDSNFIIKEINGTKFGFLGFDYTLKNDLDNDLKLIKDSKEKVDVLIVGVHWGDEYKDKANNLQRTIAKKMIEAGTDVIIGGHPHWVEDYEEINGKPVYYSLGNFIFDQMWSEETKKGLIVKMTFDGTSLIKREEFKTYINSIGQPEIVFNKN